MLFNDYSFIFFFTIVTILIWYFNNINLNLRNSFILFASYVFYTSWDYRFSILLLASTIIDFFLGKSIYKTKEKNRRRYLLFIAIGLNLTILCYFKYANFFIENGVALFSKLGFFLNEETAKIIFPVGISFYTFQSMSYSIDIYKNKLIPKNEFLNFACFISFFPQLLAGPIEKTKSLLPQFSKKNIASFQLISNSFKRIAWGLFMKLAIADNLYPIYSEVSQNLDGYSSISLICNAFLFTILVYCDYAGYTLIALGLAGVMGFKLSPNFNYPLLSKNIGEFWQRWHMTLTDWINKYVFRPLIFKMKNFNAKILRDFLGIMTVFFCVGFWHGNEMSFILWGMLHGLAFFIWSIMNLTPLTKKFKYIKTISTITTFIIISHINVAFFITHPNDLVQYYLSIITMQEGKLIDLSQFKNGYMVLIYILVVFLFELKSEGKISPLDDIKISRPLNFIGFIFLMLIILDNLNKTQQYVYFEF